MAAMKSRTAPHVAALAVFAAITATWLWPFLASPATRIPGDGPGDNFLFVWNLWWTRHALQSHVWPLWCPAIFVPFGVDLTLHTLTLLPTAIVALASPGSSVLSGTNAIIAAHLFLNFAVAYALAWRITGNISAALTGALFFGWCPYVDVRLLGHFNLIAAWTLPLTALVALQTLERGTALAAVWLGLAIAVTGYVEYYYVVYAAALVGLLACSRIARVTGGFRIAGPWHRRALASVVVCVALALGIALIIRLTGGFVLHVGGVAASLRSAHNPVAVASVMVIVGLVVALARGISLVADWNRIRRTLPSLFVAAAIATIFLLPLLISGSYVWLRGDYVSQRYFWRSAPAGIDVGTLLLGNPRGAVWQSVPLAAYRSLGITEIEQTAWLSPGLLLLCAAAVRRRAASADIRRWILVAAVFGVWALGPYLVAFGRNLPILLPATLVRYVPVVSNARIPGRAMVLVYLAAAMLGATGFLLLRQAGHTASAVACAALALVDLVPAQPPILVVDRPPIYEALRAQPQSGAVCELPLGLRDSFGETGTFDPWILWHQTIHDRPMAGGFVSRLPPRIQRAYLDAPVLGSFVRLSAGGPLDAEPAISSAAAASALASDGIAFLVVDRVRSPPALLEYVRRLKFPRLAQDALHEVLRVERVSATDDRGAR